MAQTMTTTFIREFTLPIQRCPACGQQLSEIDLYPLSAHLERGECVAYPIGGRMDNPVASLPGLISHNWNPNCRNTELHPMSQCPLFSNDDLVKRTLETPLATVESTTQEDV